MNHGFLLFYLTSLFVCLGLVMFAYLEGVFEKKLAHLWLSLVLTFVPVFNSGTCVYLVRQLKIKWDSHDYP